MADSAGSPGGKIPVWDPMGHPYEMLELIGKGAYGEVYKAYDPDSNMLVAIKKIPVPKTQKKLKLLQNELDLLQVLSSAGCHPNVICYLDHYEDQNNLHIVTEYIDGFPLSDIIEHNWVDQWVNNIGEPLVYQPDRHYPNSDMVHDILEDLINGVKHLHKYDQIHRDIKPDNILVIDPYNNPQAIIVDLGLACMASKCDESLAVGTAIYLAPERIISELSNRQHLPLETLKLSDIFSVGACVYELMVGQNFYPSNILTVDELINFIIYHYPNLDYKWYYDQELENFVRSLLNRDPYKRLDIINTYDWTNNGNNDNDDIQSSSKK